MNVTTMPTDPEVLGERARADHAEAQRDDLASALRQVLDAHYAWAVISNDVNAQRFLDARAVADSALALVPDATAERTGLINGSIVDAAMRAFVHATSHSHDAVLPTAHFMGALFEELGVRQTPQAST